MEPFWALYRQHLDSKVQEILAEYRIGNLDTESIAYVATATVSASPTAHPLRTRSRAGGATGKRQRQPPPRTQTTRIVTSHCLATQP